MIGNVLVKNIKKIKKDSIEKEKLVFVQNVSWKLQNLKYETTVWDSVNKNK